MKKTIFLFAGILILASCSNESVLTDQVEQNLSSFSSSVIKVNVCHGNAGEIIIGENAVQTHIDHGDAVDADGDGYYDKENPCSEIDCDDTTYSEDNSCVKTPLDNDNIHAAVKLWVNDELEAIKIYGDIKDWDVSSVTNMQSLFNAQVINASFNEDISGWDVSSVTNMFAMFYFQRDFNQDISGWDVSNVTNMHYMFYSVTSFNQDISDWNVSKVTNMENMFGFALGFNQDLSGWNVTSVSNCYLFSAAAIAWKLPKPNFTNCTE